MENTLHLLDEVSLSQILGGKKKRNNWADNVSGVVGSAFAGAALGSAICGPACGFVMAHYGAIGWTAITGATGGFGKIRK